MKLNQTMGLIFSALETGAGDSKPERALVQCIGSQGCNTVWAFPRNQRQVLAHASKCNWLPSNIREAALEHLGSNAIGPAAIIIPDSTVSAATGSQIDNTVTAAHRKAGQMAKGRQELKDKGDYAVMRFIMCCGILPTAVDSDEFDDKMERGMIDDGAHWLDKRQKL
ncbi:hypothetical protein BDN67DRAFT_1006278 [Paxillus ammoniavirescens]|nr:hypothetical protein BDN67DRAFT_1006278 [Paxillus ammoniavirescens]